jgi:hypothetical protein
VTDEQLTALGHPAPRVWPASDVDLAALPVSETVPTSPLYPGALVRTEGTADVHYIDVDGNLLTVDAASLASRGWTTEDVAVVPADVPTPAPTVDAGAYRRDSGLPPTTLPLRDGVLVQTPSHLVGVVSGGKFRRLWDSRMVAAYGYTGKPRLLVPTAVVTALPTAELTSR